MRDIAESIKDISNVEFVELDSIAFTIFPFSETQWQLSCMFNEFAFCMFADGFPQVTIELDAEDHQKSASATCCLGYNPVTKKPQLDWNENYPESVDLLVATDTMVAVMFRLLSVAGQDPANLFPSMEPRKSDS